MVMTIFNCGTELTNCNFLKLNYKNYNSYINF